MYWFCTYGYTLVSLWFIFPEWPGILGDCPKQETCWLFLWVNLENKRYVTAVDKRFLPLAIFKMHTVSTTMYMKPGDWIIREEKKTVKGHIDIPEFAFGELDDLQVW